jgi:hypothetical protein
MRLALRTCDRREPRERYVEGDCTSCRTEEHEKTTTADFHCCLLLARFGNFLTHRGPTPQSQRNYGRDVFTR